MNRLLLPLALAVVAPASMAQCVITPTGTLQPNVVDTFSSIVPLGFAFDFQGTTFTDIYWSDHGVVALTNGGVPPVPPGGVQVFDPGSQPNTTAMTGGLALNGGGFAGFGANCICPYWGDHVIGGSAGAGVYIDNTSGTYCTITWVDNEPFGAGAADAFTVQLSLFDNGNVQICLDSRCDNTSSTYDPVTTVIGITDGSIPPEVDFSSGPVVSATATIFEEFTGAGPISTNTPDPLFDLANTIISFIPTSPGWLSTTAPLDCASKNTYGSGCVGLALDSNPPVIGTNWDLTTTGLTVFDAITFFGTSSNVVGLPLLAIGINSPGCNIHIDGLVGNLTAPNVGGTAVLTVPVPANATLKGATLTAQSVSLDLSLPGLIGTSNGLEVVLGY